MMNSFKDLKLNATKTPSTLSLEYATDGQEPPTQYETGLYEIAPMGDFEYLSLIMPKATPYETDLYINSGPKLFESGSYDLAKSEIIAVTKYWVDKDNRIVLNSGTIKIERMESSITFEIDVSGNNENAKVRIKGHVTAPIGI